MTVRELIKALSKLPQDVDVRVWDEESDEYVPVTDALLEDGSTCVDLLPRFEPSEPSSAGEGEKR